MPDVTGVTAAQAADGCTAVTAAGHRCSRPARVSVDRMPLCWQHGGMRAWGELVEPWIDPRLPPAMKDLAKGIAGVHVEFVNARGEPTRLVRWIDHAGGYATCWTNGDGVRRLKGDGWGRN